MKQERREPNIHTRESLQQEQSRLRLVIKAQETALRQRIQKLPGELFYAGADAIVLAVLTGKITSSVLHAGKYLINKVVEKNARGNTSKLLTAAKRAGLFSILTIAYSVFVKRKI